jgi:hypothetical protein
MLHDIKECSCDDCEKIKLAKLGYQVQLGFIAILGVVGVLLVAGLMIEFSNASYVDGVLMFVFLMFMIMWISPDIYSTFEAGRLIKSKYWEKEDDPDS